MSARISNQYELFLQFCEDWFNFTGQYRSVQAVHDNKKKFAEDYYTFIQKYGQAFISNVVADESRQATFLRLRKKKGGKK